MIQEILFEKSPKAVYDDVFRWLNENEKEPELPESPEGALSQHLAPGDGESVAPSLDGSDKALPFSDDQGLWDLTGPDAVRLQQLQADLDAGKIPEFQHLRWL